MKIELNGSTAEFSELYGSDGSVIFTDSRGRSVTVPMALVGSVWRLT